MAPYPDLAVAGLGAFLLALIGGGAFARLARSRGWGQHIREWGPKIHAGKEGTPTMGGLVILVSFTAMMALLWLLRREWPSPQELLLLIGTLSFGGIGLLDDLLSLRGGCSQGLPIRYKLLLEFALSGLLIWALWQAQVQAGELLKVKVPFMEGWLELPPPAWAALALFVLVGTANAMNLTDGLDGLAAGTTLVILGAYLWLLPRQEGLFPSTLILGLSLLGFLWHNCHPAGIFLGDVGSLALGGFVALLALLSGTALILPLLGGLLVIETLSVILQIMSYRLFKVRIFKVSPLHHHFERAEGIDYEFLLPNRELPEPKITLRLWIVAAILALLGLLASR